MEENKISEEEKQTETRTTFQKEAVTAIFLLHFNISCHSNLNRNKEVASQTKTHLKTQIEITASSCFQALKNYALAVAAVGGACFSTILCRSSFLAPTILSTSFPSFRNKKVGMASTLNSSATGCKQAQNSPKSES